MSRRCGVARRRQAGREDDRWRLQACRQRHKTAGPASVTRTQRTASRLIRAQSGQLVAGWSAVSLRPRYIAAKRADHHAVLTALVIEPMILGGTAGVLAVVVIARIVLGWAMGSS